jgi:Domain of unknown function (DUF4265)
MTHPRTKEVQMPSIDERSGAVRLLVSPGSSGRPVYEDVSARGTADGGWVLDASPGLALGAAAGDVVEVDPDGTFRVISRGGNVAVHVAAPAAANSQRDALTEAIRALGGWLDGRGWTRDGASSLSVYTIPVSAGFPAIQDALAAFSSAAPGSEWYYANVYDPADDKTPLNWWL